MNKQKRFNQAAKALTKAFVNDEFNLYRCSSCGIGCIVKEAGLEPISWYTTASLAIDINDYSPEKVKELCEKTGYTLLELGLFERFLLRVYRDRYTARSEKLYDLLCDAIDYLAELDGIDLSVATEKKKELVRNKMKTNERLI